MKMMLREIAAGADVSYASLSADYSASNYSSSRLALLDDRDVWRVLQQWWIRSFRVPFHKRFVQQAILARAVAVPVTEYAADPAKFEATRFKPRGWSWVDPTREVQAAKEGVRAGFTTVTDVIAATGEGRDIEDFIATRKRELQLLEEAGIEVDTTVPEGGVDANGQPLGKADPDEADSNTDPAADPGADPKRAKPMLRTAA